MRRSGSTGPGRRSRSPVGDGTDVETVDTDVAASYRREAEAFLAFVAGERAAAVRRGRRRRGGRAHRPDPGRGPVTVTCVIQARMGSTRFPGKVLEPLGGAPMLRLLIDRLRPLAVEHLVVATTDLDRDDPVAALADAAGAEVVRGSGGGRARALRARARRRTRRRRRPAHRRLPAHRPGGRRRRARAPRDANATPTTSSNTLIRTYPRRARRRGDPRRRAARRDRRGDGSGRARARHPVRLPPPGTLPARRAPHTRAARQRALDGRHPGGSRAAPAAGWPDEPDLATAGWHELLDRARRAGNPAAPDAVDAPTRGAGGPRCTCWRGATTPTTVRFSATQGRGHPARAPTRGSTAVLSDPGAPALDRRVSDSDAGRSGAGRRGVRSRHGQHRARAGPAGSGLWARSCSPHCIDGAGRRPAGARDWSRTSPTDNEASLRAFLRAGLRGARTRWHGWITVERRRARRDRLAPGAPGPDRG